MTPSPESRLLDLIRKKRGPTAKERWMSTLKRSPRWVNEIKGDSVVPWRWANGCLALLLGGTVTYGGFVFCGKETPPIPNDPVPVLRFFRPSVQPARNASPARPDAAGPL
jgi:hypothetical protein